MIASTQGAIDQGRNQLTTGTLTVADITNTSHYKATGVNLSGGYAAGGSNGKSDGKSDGGSGDSASSQMPSTANNGSSWSWQNQGSGARGTAAGYDSKSGSQTSITHSGISGGALTITDAAGQQAKSGQSVADTLAALKRDVHTGDSGNGLVKDWNGQQLQQQVTAGAQIMATFGQQASKAIGDYASQKALELRGQGNEAEAAKWDEGGVYRVAAHAAMGALGGGVQGALGAGAAASAAPKLTELTKDLPDGVREAVGAGLAAGLGAVTGGASGAATAFNEDTNNRQLHPVEMSFLAAEAAKYAEYAKISEKEATQLLIAASLDQLDSTAQAQTTGQDAAKYQAAANWLASEAADAHLGFVNEKGELQQAFTATKSQFYDPTLYDQPYRGNLLTKITDKVFDTHLTAGHSITMDDYLSVGSDLKLEGQYQLWRATRPADMSKWSADDLQTMSGFVQKNDLRLMAKLGIFGPIGASWVSLSDGDYKGVVDNAAINIAGGVVPVGSVGRSLEHAGEAVIDASRDVRLAQELNSPAKTSVKELEVDSYRELKSREVVGDGLEHDHIPSFAALRTAKEAELGRPLTDAETKVLYQNATAVEVTKEVHVAGPTYGGKNTIEQIQKDASDLCDAVCRNTDSLRYNLISRGYDSKLVDETVQKIIERNRKMGIIK
ncbi:hypothetical protein [Xanthomonas sp. MUS 060]|uniref:hypothetical protein n=1 Tax=Xanthomonas sp. MUS 060 TaxID=1588031 RepID=UPI001F238886|nr:hypothetical protein [Xanthomonas sp. MUS 060]